MKIAYVTPRYSPFIGGVEHHVEQLARRAAAAGAQVTVFTQDGDATPTDHNLDVDISRHRPALPAAHLAVSPGLLRELRARVAEFDVVHAHSYHATAALAAALAPTRRLIFTPHYHGTGHGPLRAVLHVPYRRIGGHTFTRADQVICVSRSEADLVHRHFRVGGKITVIPNGTQRRDGTADTETIPVTKPVVLSVGRLESYKRVDRLLRATSATNAPLFDVRIIGAGPERSRLEALARDLGIADRVEFLGRVDDLALDRWLKSATVLVSFSEREAFGMSIAEALQAGARVVASAIPAHEEVIANAGPGVATTVPADFDPEALGALLSEAVERGRIPAGDVPELPSWDDVAERTFAIYGWAR